MQNEFTLDKKIDKHILLEQARFSVSSDSKSQSVNTAQGILLVNLGTPDAPETGAVRRYLRQFLSDPRVIDISALGRFLLLNLIILPFRPSKSAEAYRLVWTEQGSPIIEHGRKLTELVQKQLDDRKPGGYKVKLAMRYGQPSIESVMREFRDEGIDNIKVVSLFPQYASATIGSAMEEVYRVANSQWNMQTITATPAYYEHPGYVGAFAEVTTEAVGSEKYDYYLFSFHGLPERHVRKADAEDNPGKAAHCLADGSCCESISVRNRNCYRAQCYASARGIAKELGLADGAWSVSFQSRLGRDPWIRPYTDEVMKELPATGVKSLAVLSPAFVADCLETLEELGLRGEEDFIKAGGLKYKMIPSLNTHPRWVDTVVELATTTWYAAMSEDLTKQEKSEEQTEQTEQTEQRKKVDTTMTANTFEPALSRKGLVTFSGLVWSGAGVMLLTRAYFMVETLTAGVIVFILAGIAIGALKSHFVLRKVARRNIKRIKTMSPAKDKICLFAFQPLMSYVLIMIMVGAGLSLRHFFPHSIYLASFYFAIGSALLYSGIDYFRGASKV